MSKTQAVRGSRLEGRAGGGREHSEQWQIQEEMRCRGMETAPHFLRPAQ